MPKQPNYSDDERKRRWEQRWATPGDSPLEQWFWSMMRYYNRRPDPEVFQHYERVFRDIPIEEVKAVTADHIEDPQTPSNRPPLVNELKARWTRRRKEKDRKIAARQRARAAKQQTAEEVDAERETAWRATMCEFADILGTGVVFHVEHSYRGNFNCHQVALAATHEIDMDRFNELKVQGGKAPRENLTRLVAATHDFLRTLFAEEWDQFQQERTSDET